MMALSAMAPSRLVVHCWWPYVYICIYRNEYIYMCVCVCVDIDIDITNALINEYVGYTHTHMQM
jgi:hypothetical protein